MFAFFFLEDLGYTISEIVVFSPNEKKSRFRRLFNKERDIFTCSIFKYRRVFMHVLDYENSGETKEV